MERWWMPRHFRLVTEGLLNKDDPDHYRLRNLVHKAFTLDSSKHYKPISR